MKKILILIISMMLVIMVFAIGCSKQANEEPATRISGKTTYDAEPQIDKSYDVKRTEDATSQPVEPRQEVNTQTVREPALSDEDRARQIATEYIKKLDGYKYFNGRNLKIKSVVEVSGEGNFLVEATFWRDTEKSMYKTEEPINVRLNIKKWKADSYRFG